MNPRMVEGINGAWFYHLQSEGASPARALCGASVMLCFAPLDTWGQVGHLRERYCERCQEIADQMMPGWRADAGATLVIDGVEVR